MTRRDWFALALTGLPLAAEHHAGGSGPPAWLSLADARPVLDEFAAELPAALRGAPLNEASWLAWETAHDREIRARLDRGDADSIVNLVLFGSSFTARPRFTGGDTEEAGQLVLARVGDFAAAVTGPARSERLEFAARWLRAQGADPSAATARQRIAAVLIENVRRVLREQREYARKIAEAKRDGDAASLFVKRSSLYGDRGLSLDTSFRPDFAIERALVEIKQAGLLREVKRAAVIGPGLDFTDKRSGYDFYPVQTLQPFALLDSLRKLGLARGQGAAIQVLDLSERVLDHVRQAVSQARKGTPYTVQLALDEDTRWLPATVDYWRGFGSEIGVEAKPLSPPPGVKARMRAIRIRTDAVQSLDPADLDIVTRHLSLSTGEKFDLVIATNVLVYYSQFEQGLALRNLAAMLHTGALLLSNNALPEISGVSMKPVGATSVAYSDDPDDGDRILWYKQA